uniref:NADH-ubiquinone oxidoreductase chain 6 n=1 Tax=Heterodermia speciosa TaxID=116794 RepID=A0A3G2Z7R9_9LECA|nr:NADH dehydrogenase subunit 6 [Heterodermia speciosa]AYP35449.1 NADH dehydrogenase subunit 6 [Heterodermia speciosa]
MDNLFVLKESLTTGYIALFLDLISIVSVMSGILVIISKNPIVSVLFLIALFLGIACYLIILGISFIGLSYLLVYVGAVSILFLFILMLINIRLSEMRSNTSNTIPLAFFIGISFIYPVYQLLPYNLTVLNINDLLLHIFFFSHNNNNNTDYFGDSTSVIFVTSMLWDGSLSETTHITSLGNVMYTSYSIWLIITSAILLLAMVGAIIITIKQND